MELPHLSIPAGLPHRVLKEDEYLGYRIPRSSTIIANIWLEWLLNVHFYGADYP